MRYRPLILALAAGVLTFSAAEAYRRSQPRGAIRWKMPQTTVALDRSLVTALWGRAPTILGTAERPDIVVIVLDTVRRDRLGTYGYDQGTTPRLDAWAKDARVYDNLLANAPWTLPSHASMFTGKYPIEHGARGTPPDASSTAAALAPQSPTVARALRSAGYRTAAIAANKAFLDSTWGLDQGFDVYLCETAGKSPKRVPYTTGDRITAMAETALSRKEDDPVFLFLNYMDAHSPWVVRQGYTEDPDRIDFSVLPQSAAWDNIEDTLYTSGDLPEDAPESWSLAYDASLRFLDEQVGTLLERLPSLGIDENDYVFVVSDHGEYLGEHGLVEHSKDVYQQVLEVPLLIRGPGYTAGRDDAPLQHHDLATMILAAAGLPPLPGAVLTEALQVSELYYTRRKDLHKAEYGDRFNRIRRAFVEGDEKLILGSDGSEEAYDLASDPLEAKNLLSSAPWVSTLRETATLWYKSRNEAPLYLPAREPDLDALKALGYLQ